MLKIDLTPKNPPDLIIGPPTNPYMERWYIRKAGVADLYIHKISRSDDARALHDHRSDNLSIVLSGTYTEIIAPRNKMHPSGYNLFEPITRKCGPGSVVFRKAEQPHRLIVENGKPVWTLWFKFKDRRDWGFWQPYYEDYGPEWGSRLMDHDWVQWQQYEERYGARV